MSTFFHIDSEVGNLKKILIHSPDNGLGKVIPSRAQDWLFEDIVHLDTIRRGEYDYYVKLLLYFLDPEKVNGRLKDIDDPQHNREFYQPGHHHFHRSEQVIELQWLLAEVLVDDALRSQMIAAVCALEGCTQFTQDLLSGYSATELANTFISGMGSDKSLLFAPIPNFIFTRDIGIVIKDHLVLNKPAKPARLREALLARYIFFHHPLFSPFRRNIIELHQNRPAFLMPENDRDELITLEGGDVMMVSPNHLLIGISERTTASAAIQLSEAVFEKGLVNKVTLITIPPRRDFMHIDTIFTAVRRDVWVLMGVFSDKALDYSRQNTMANRVNGKTNHEAVSIMQFSKSDKDNPRKFSSLEALLRDISKTDYGCETVQIIFSGNNEYPYAAREQWTDSCNLLALREGVVLAYDRNEKTNEAFRTAGFRLIKVADLLQDLEQGRVKTEEIRNTVILMPSAELSRARGGFHCMSMPLYRNSVLSSCRSTVLMIQPCSFGFNEETAKDNYFQQKTDVPSAQEKALEEFNNFVSKLRENGINVQVVQDTPKPSTPDSIFPNNWISFHEQGKVVLYPMLAPNRRAERKKTVIDAVKKFKEVGEWIDFTHFEQGKQFLEGTGSLVLDRTNKIAYAALSQRTHPDLVRLFCERLGYRPVMFEAADAEGREIYHTNVLMCVAAEYVVLCTEAIKNTDTLFESIRETGKTIIPITFSQMNHFCGNLLQLETAEGEKVLVMSSQAFEHFTAEQKEQFALYNRIIHSPLTTIETLGGGSARCMLCEVY